MLVIGETYGRLSYVKMVDKINALFVCSCGTKRVCSKYNVLKGKTKSCGCLKRENVSGRFGKHKQTNTAEYIAWKHLKQRCYNPNDKSYVDYGARGISVCEEWRNDFEKFYAYVGPRPSSEHSIDRIDNDGNYEPGNVKWSTKTEQINNRRNSRLWCYNGVDYTLKQLAEIAVVDHKVLELRIYRGWDIAKAVETPKTYNKNAIIK